MPDWLKRLIREPLVHFLVLGAALFVAIGIARDLQRPTVRLTAAELNQLATYWETQMQRPPTKVELAAIIQDRVDEELLAREAVRLGLDKDDMIVRRRLAQKMSFASEDLAAAREPDEATLKASFERSKARYATPARVALTHVFFSRDRTGVSPQTAAAEALAAARKGARLTGDPSLLPLAYADASLDDLARDFGDAFAAVVKAAPAGTWSGPVTSPYGLHIVRVETRRAPETPTFEAVRAEVRDAWLAERRSAGNRAYLERLRKRYRVKVAGVEP